MTHHHAIVWIDHTEARLVTLADEGADFQVKHVHSHDHHTHQHKGGGHRHPADAHLLEQVAQFVAETREVALCGPGTTKDELVAFLESKHPKLRERIVSIEAIDHPTDGQLADHGRKVLRSADRMRGVHVG